MSDVVNLNKFRKRKAASEKARDAEANRRKHGRTKAERRKQEEEDARLRRLLDGHERDGED